MKVTTRGRLHWIRVEDGAAMGSSQVSMSALTLRVFMNENLQSLQTLSPALCCTFALSHPLQHASSSPFLLHVMISWYLNGLSQKLCKTFLMRCSNWKQSAGSRGVCDVPLTSSSRTRGRI